MTVLRTVGRFEILGEVGRGGMAMVWLARQTDLERLVALKELAPFHASDPTFAGRFLRESRIAGSLNHPNIVTVYDYFESDGVPFISMEYLERGSLRPLIGSLSLAQVAYVLEGMFAALAYAEQQGIVHRDLKPENVLVRPDGQVKIADFGIAKALNQTTSGDFRTRPGTTIGTAEYMAPEQAMAKELGPYTDLYSTGVMAYEMLVQQLPFAGGDTPVALMLRHVNEPPPPPRSVAPDLDPAIEAWLLKLLEKDPADRYQHASDAWDAFEEIADATAGPRWRRDAREAGLGGTPIPTPSPMADPFRPVAPVATAQPVRAPEVESYEWPAFGDEPPKPASRSRRPIAIGIALAILVVAGVAAAIGLSGRGSGSAVSVTSSPVSTATRSTTTAAAPPDVPVPAASRVSLAAAGGSLFVAHPGGQIARLAGRTLRQLALAGDGGRPRALGVRGHTLFVLDDRTILRLSADRLSPTGASSFGSGSMLGGGGSSPLVVAAGHRVCMLTAAAVGPCGRATFEVTGVGYSSDGTVLAVDGAHGRIQAYRQAGKRLVASGPAIAVGLAARGSVMAHGPVLVAGTRAFVAVPRGLAVVDLTTRRRISTIDLKQTPGVPALVDGVIVAPLPGLRKVALVPAGGTKQTPRLIATGPLAYAAAAGPGALAYVANAGDGSVTLIDVQRGRALRRVRVTALRGSAVARAILRRVTTTTSGGQVIVTLQLGPGSIDASGVRPAGAIQDGAASIELWQGSLVGGIAPSTAYGITTRVHSAPGRLLVQLSAAPGVFTALGVARAVGGREIIVTLTPRPVTSTQTTSTSQSTRTTRTRSTSQCPPLCVH